MWQLQNHKKGSQENGKKNQLRKRLLILCSREKKQILILRNPEIQIHEVYCLLCMLSEFLGHLTCIVTPSSACPVLDGVFTIQFSVKIRTWQSPRILPTLSFVATQWATKFCELYFTYIL